MRGLHLIFPRNTSVRADLPEPSADERAHSERLASRIREEIAASGGTIDFARYMELALYAPGLGYYSAGATKFGAAGDFITAPELGFVFARCLARALVPALRATRGDILEIGPGSGALAAELLLELERLEVLPPRYRLLERGADLRERQRTTLQQRCPQLLERCMWIDAPPRESWRGVIVANEVIDALPVRLFKLREEGVFARTVALDGQNHFVWNEIPADIAFAESVAHTLGERMRELPRPYTSEICVLLLPWFEEITRSLEHGEAWFIDYGCDRASYYAAARSAGTLRCHYRHRAHNDPLILPGLQDITAWVDFDAVTQAAANAGFATIANVPQSRFLIEHGLDEVFAQAHGQATDETSRYRLAQQVKRLTLPGEMGEAFRVCALRRR
jgi:SAM-dependent MidA family methyltransferase